jgi:hypothetical protein
MRVADMEAGQFFTLDGVPCIRVTNCCYPDAYVDLETGETRDASEFLDGDLATVDLHVIPEDE